jgi:dTDP-4-dehydrorhamnose reductase
MNDKPRLWVVGARGYIGNEILNAAQGRWKVFATSSSKENEFQFLRLDSATDFDYGLIRAKDVVLLCGALSSPDICAKEFNRAWAVNVEGTSIFVHNALLKGARVVFFSSDTVYGESKENIDESSICKPSGEYAGMKREVEQRFAGNASFKTIRISYVFSREDKFSLYLGKCAKNKEEAILYHPFYRSVVHRADIVEGVLELAARWEDFTEPIINFGGPDVISRVEFTQCLQKIFYHELSVSIVEPDDTFFSSRPRVIAMKSPVFCRILRRSPRTLVDAAQMEFNSSFRK